MYTSFASKCTTIQAGSLNHSQRYSYPARACVSKGLCEWSWCLYIVIYLQKKFELFFFLSKYSLSDTHFNTGRLLFEFNRLLYALAAPEVFVSSANPVSLPSGYRSSETQTLTRSKPHPYGIACCMLLLISLAFEHCVGHCACVSACFVLKSMRVKGRTQNAMFKRK